MFLSPCHLINQLFTYNGIYGLDGIYHNVTAVTMI